MEGEGGMKRYASPIVRNVVETYHGATRKLGSKVKAQRDSGVGARAIVAWKQGAEPMLSNAEALLNACGYTLIIVPLDKPVEPLS